MATRPEKWHGQTRSSEFQTHGFQRLLAQWNGKRLAPALPVVEWQESIDLNARMQRLEGHFLEDLRYEVAHRAAQAPTDVQGFLAWFEDLRVSGPGQRDPLFPWLAETASLDDFRYYLTQEAAGEAGFEDLTALTQVKVPAAAKMELANNYWDEMGRGNPKGMHGPMLGALLEELELKPAIEETAWESLALANAMTAMATNRQYAWHSIGALGIIELTAPDRSRATAAGLKRLGIGGKARRYFELHAVLDVKHSDDWKQKVIAPLVAQDPRRTTAMAEGALIRLTAGARCFERYRRELWS